MKLSHIIISGIMSGHAWGGFDCKTEFKSVFYPRPDGARSVGTLPDTWTGLDNALQSALAWGDVWGGQGDLVEGWLEFHLVEVSGRDVIRRIISRDLDSMNAAKSYFPKERAA